MSRIEDVSYQKKVKEFLEEKVLNASVLVWKLAEKADCFPEYEEDLLGAYEARRRDDEVTEVFEHWIVPEDLALRLEEHGEKVIRNMFGFNIWCRTCTGQAIYLDSVMCDIYDEAHTPRDFPT